MELQGRIKELEAQGLGAAAISYDSVDVLAEFAGRRGITDPLLSDQGSVAIKAFGILNTVAEEAIGPNRDDPAVRADTERYVAVGGGNAIGIGTPFPGTFVVDREGLVTARFFEEFYRERTTTSRIMLRLGAQSSSVAGFEGDTAHLTFRAYQSNPEVSIGSIFTLALEVTPKPGMHLYAPGAEAFGYKLTRLTFEESPHLRMTALEYPESEIYNFVPLDERVPVYQPPFTLLQDVVVEASREAHRALRGVEVLTMTGRLDYQACDQEKCFTPVSVPLTWTVALAPPDRQRAKHPG